jgi:purine-nucleoside phosphorylase
MKIGRRRTQQPENNNEDEGMELRRQVDEAVDFLRGETDISPRVGLILGTGLGGLAEEIDVSKGVPYGKIPHFPASTVETHAGELLFGTLCKRSVVAMRGRFHYYEGHSMAEITLPVRVMKFLGIKTVLISNAAGGMNPFLRHGDLMVIDDHINLIGTNPLIGVDDERLGPRFPDMSEPYSSDLIKLAEGIALEEQIPLKKGTYVAVSGPNLETKAEYRFLRGIGADAVGMSTVPEVIVAAQSGLKVFAVSVITDRCLPDALEPVNIKAIIKTARKAEPNLTRLMKRIVERL